MITFILMFVFQVFVFNEAYDFSCPSQSHWKLRANSMCMHPRNYSCLFDVNYQINVYRDKCIRPRILGPGYTYVFQPNPNRASCILSRYQPFIFNTTGYSKCAFLKSFCKSEGQITYTNGTTRSDRRCSCNARKGFQFVINQKNGYFCNPFSEDCSCYIEKIPNNRPINCKDKSCHGDINIDQSREHSNALYISLALTNISFGSYNYNLVYTTDKHRSKAVIYVFILILLYPPFAFGTCILQIFIQKWIHNYREKQRLKDKNKQRYIKLVQSKKQEENRYFVRIMIVGKERVGKTCLMKRLLNERVKKNEPSTYGVNIVIQRCKINISDGKWTIGKDMSDGMAERFQRAMQPIQNESFEIESSMTDVLTDVPNSFRKQSEEINAKATNNDPRPADNRLRSKSTNTPSDLICSTETVNKVLVSSTETLTKISDSRKEMIGDRMDLKADKTERKKGRTSSNLTTHDIAKLNKNEIIDNNVILNNGIDIDNEEDDKSLSFVMPKDLMSFVLSKTKHSDTLSNQHALCSLWDFAGQKEFYATHQAFLTSGAIYLVVADIDDDISHNFGTQHFADYREVGGYVDFWFDAIHCHRTTNISVNEPVNHNIDPPIFIVFTGKDKHEKEYLEQRMTVLQAQLGEILGNHSKYHHLRDILFVSNFEDSEEEFEKLREKISEAAKQMQHWGELKPLKWILLEHLIEINKKEKYFVTFSDIVNMAKHSDIEMTGIEDIRGFLHFQHKVGNIIFFDDIQDFIILNPQWLVDAFRCLASDKIPTSLQHLDDWGNFVQNGKISKYLITELFKLKGGISFLNQRDNLLEVMGKFDILVKIGDTFYIMPSMMPSVPFDTVCEKIGVKGQACKRTSWFCLKFAFLPPAFFNHVYVWFIRKYTPMEVGNDTKSLASLFRGIGVFDTDISKCKKILVTMSADTIAIQLLSFSREDDEEKNIGSICSEIHSDLIKEIKAIIERYHLQISYQLHFKCSTGDYWKDTMSYDDLQKVSQYFCGEHTMAHLSEEIVLPWTTKANVRKTIINNEGNFNSKQDELNHRNKKGIFNDAPDMDFKQDELNKSNSTDKSKEKIEEGDETRQCEATDPATLFVVAIDFGTTYSGYAFSARSTPNDIYVSKWIMGKLLSMKAPTAVLIDKNKEFVAFGFEAVNKYLESLEQDDSDSDDKDSGHKDEFHYFNRFKMMLHNQTVNLDTTIKDQNGMHMKAFDIVSFAIKYLKDQAIGRLVKTRQNVETNDIHYVLTVPAIWDDQAKIFMRKAAEKAGIKGKDLTIALEPETASICCQELRTNRDGNSNKTISETIKKGTKYVLIDLGGGTADITVHERLLDDSLEEVLPPSGGNWGGTAIDKAYKRFLYSVFTKKVIKELKSDELEDYYDLCNEFEEKKRWITSSSFRDIVITLPYSLVEITVKHCKSVQSAITQSSYKDSVSFAKPLKLFVNPKVFRKLFKPTIDALIKHLEKLFKHPNLIDLHYIIMVGGFSKCELVQTAMRKSFPNRKIINPDKDGLAVLRGAVLFGHQPKKIGKRILRKTYGIRSWPEWDAEIHPDTKKVRFDGVDRCKDVFYKFAVKGEKVEDGHSSGQIFQALKTDEKTLECTVFISDDTNPRYVTDPSCQRLGNHIVQIPPLKKGETLEIEETMIFGGTEILFRAKNMRSGDICESQFELF